MTPRKLPATITLPNDCVVELQHLLAQFGGVSRQCVHTWRKRCGFPRSFRDGCKAWFVTEDVAAWLIRRGVTVRRI